MENLITPGGGKCIDKGGHQKEGTQYQDGAGFDCRSRVRRHIRFPLDRAQPTCTRHVEISPGEKNELATSQSPT
jgi:hypothetical protein